MYTIGEFAAFGRVSVRMLRHYDAIGLLTPAHVDERSGYRYYRDDQMPQLLRIVELRDLGCRLDDAAQVLGAPDETTALRAVLSRRRGEIEASLAVDRARLARIDERLRTLEGAPPVSTTTAIEYRTLEPVTVYAAHTSAPGMGPENIGPAIGPLIGRLRAALDGAGTPVREPGIFWYQPDESDESDDVTIHVSWVADGDPRPGEGYEVVHLPRVERAAVLVHHGAMSEIGTSWVALTEGLLADGFRMAGPGREVYLESEPLPQSQWVTELQMPVERSG